MERKRSPEMVKKQKRTTDADYTGIHDYSVDVVVRFYIFAIRGNGKIQLL